MAWPLTLGSVSFAIMDFTDKYFVAQLGPSELAAVGSAGLWTYTLGVFFVHLAACVSTFVSQSLGRQRKEDCASYAWQGIYVSISAGAFAVLLWPIVPTLFTLMGHATDVTRLETEYMQIRLLGFLFIAWQTALASFFTAIGRPVIPMCVSVFADMLNLLLAWSLVFGHLGFPRLEIAGAAWATVASLTVQTLVLQMIFMSKPLHEEYGTRQAYRPNAVRLRELLRIGWPSGVTSFLDWAAGALITSAIIGGGGRTVHLAAHTAAVSFMHLSSLPVMGLGQATTAITGRWIGAGETGIAKARAYTAMRLGMGFMAVSGLVSVVLGKQLMSLMTSDPEVIRLGRVVLICGAVFATFDAISMVLAGALRGAGDTRWTMWIQLLGSFFVLLPVAYFFARVLDWGVTGAWMGGTLYVVLLSLVILRRFHGERWKHIVIFEEDRPKTRDDGVAATVQGDPATP